MTIAASIVDSRSSGHRAYLGLDSGQGCSLDAKGNITNRREYGYQVSGAWLVRRRTRTTYTTIATTVNLPTEVDVYDALLNTSDADDVMIAKATYAYDNYVSMGGMEDTGAGSVLRVT